MHFFKREREERGVLMEVYVVAGYRPRIHSSFSSPTLSVIARCSLPFGSQYKCNL
jgi:hypothetical protein